MDTTRSQQVLSFQRYSSWEADDEIRARAGWKARSMRMAAPVLAGLMRRKAPYYKQPGQYADPWGAIRANLGDPSWDPPNGAR